MTGLVVSPAGGSGTTAGAGTTAGCGLLSSSRGKSPRGGAPSESSGRSTGTTGAGRWKMSDGRISTIRISVIASRVRWSIQRREVMVRGRSRRGRRGYSGQFGVCPASNPSAHHIVQRLPACTSSRTEYADRAMETGMPAAGTAQSVPRPPYAGFVLLQDRQQPFIQIPCQLLKVRLVNRRPCPYH